MQRCLVEAYTFEDGDMSLHKRFALILLLHLSLHLQFLETMLQTKQLGAVSYCMDVQVKEPTL